MPIDITKEGSDNIGRVVYQWTVKEYEKYDRSGRWYLIMGGLAILLIVYAAYAGNYLFALVIILFIIVLYLHQMQEPRDVPFAITETGIVLGKKYYRYSELENFYVIYNPPDVKALYFSLNNLLRHRLQIPLLDYDPRPIREQLGLYLLEDLDQEEEPLADRFARVFRLH